MGIQNIQIKGYRSLKDVTWKPGKLNVIIGPNGSGKSNLLRALALLQSSASGEMQKAILKQGGIAPLLWDGSAKEIGWVLKADPVGDNRDVRREALTYELRLQRLGNTSSYRVQHEILGNYSLVESGKEDDPFKFLERSEWHTVTFDIERRKLSAHEGSIPDDQEI